jgi:hypothetical protein
LSVTAVSHTEQPFGILLLLAVLAEALSKLHLNRVFTCINVCTANAHLQPGFCSLLLLFVLASYVSSLSSALKHRICADLRM